MSVESVDSVARSRQLGLVSVRVLFPVAAAQVDTGLGVVIEANLRRSEAAEDLAQLQARSRTAAVYCWIPMETVLQRVRARSESGGRHPGHRDRDRLATDMALFDPSRYDPAPLGIRTVRVDMTDGYDLERVVSLIRAALRRN